MPTDFYTSSTFWTAITAVATVFLIAATLVVRSPQSRRLSYRTEVVPLLNSEATIGLEVHRGGTRLDNPHVVELVLTNTGRQDIVSEAFDQQDPITADFGVPILEDLGCTAKPPSSRPPRSSITGTELHILPGRFGRGDVMTYRVLVDGHPKRRTLTHQLVQGKLELDRGGVGAPPGYIWPLGAVMGALVLQIIVGATGWIPHGAANAVAVPILAAAFVDGVVRAAVRGYRYARQQNP
ncbi:hypothetical protein [Streptomyces sp. TR06-5]|uniref:hypothetical protein n=1 Tax=Streptomyces sp. TR06-5 TaxID=3385976 RepID=UPI0039A2B2E5